MFGERMLVGHVFDDREGCPRKWEDEAGPAPTPTQLKLLTGERDLRRVQRSEPIPRDSEPVEPDWFSDEERTVWREACDELRAMGMLSAADQHVLMLYASAVADFQN